MKKLIVTLLLASTALGMGTSTLARDAGKYLVVYSSAKATPVAVDIYCNRQKVETLAAPNSSWQGSFDKKNKLFSIGMNSCFFVQSHNKSRGQSKIAKLSFELKGDKTHHNYLVRQVKFTPADVSAFSASSKHVKNGISISIKHLR